MNDMPESYTEKFRKARKEHKCTSCIAKIQAGERYTSLSVIWNGKQESYKICDNCNTLINDFKKMDNSLEWDEGPSLCRGGVGAWLQDFMCNSWYGEGAAEDIAELFDVPIEYVNRVCGINDNEGGK